MVRRTIIASALGVGLAISGGVGIAAATTGVGTGLPQPRVNVEPQIGDLFVGRYVIRTIDRNARVTAGQIMMDYTETPNPYLIGNLALFGFDRSGRASSTTSNVYPFSFRNRVLRANILSQGSNKRLGAVTFVIPDNPNDQSGTITWNGVTTPVTYQRIDDDTDPTAPLPDAQLIDARPPKLTKSGFGANNASYYGTYNLQPLAEDPGSNASLFAPLVRVATSISTGELDPTSGNLRLLAQQGGGPIGIMTLHQPGSTRVEYLGNWKWGGKFRTADVLAGSASGPRVGTFTGTLTGGRLTGSLTLGRQSAELTFSK